MAEPAARKLAELLRQDPRYPFEAYRFVSEGLVYAHRVLGMGAAKPNEPVPGQEASHGEQHLTGQQLCEAIRIYALEQFGYMARCVLAQWGLTTTGDFGEIVYNLIRIGEMRKSQEDRREDFDGVYDFEAAFQRDFRFQWPKRTTE